MGMWKMMRFIKMKKMKTYSYLSFRLIYLCRLILVLCFISLDSGCMIELWLLCHMTSAHHHEIQACGCHRAVLLHGVPCYHFSEENCCLKLSLVAPEAFWSTGPLCVRYITECSIFCRL